MLVREIMTPSPEHCRPEDTMAQAAKKMRDNDCGILPVVEGNKVVGVVTDRDMCLAMAILGGGASAPPVRGAMSHELYACSPGDPMEHALEAMGRNKVRRLIVVEDGSLAGVVSMDDLVLHSRRDPGPGGGPSYQAIVETLQRIYEHPVVVSS